MKCWNKSTQSVANILGHTFMQIKYPWTQSINGVANNGGNTPHCGDNASPNVTLIHDNINNRWIIERRVVGSDGQVHLCVAISNIDNVTQTSNPAFGFFAYEYNLNSIIPLDPSGASKYYPDYPQAGLWNTGDSHATLLISYDLILQEAVVDPNWSGPQPVAAGTIYGTLICVVEYGFSGSNNGLLNSSITATTWTNKTAAPVCVVNPLTAFNTKRSWAPSTNDGTNAPAPGEQQRVVYLVFPANDGSGTWFAAATDTSETLPITIDWSAMTPALTEGTVFAFNTPLANPQEGILYPVAFGCFYPGSYYNTACIDEPYSVTPTAAVAAACSGSALRECDTASSDNWTGSTFYFSVMAEDANHRLISQSSVFYSKTFTTGQGPEFFNIPQNYPHAIAWHVFSTTFDGHNVYTGDTRYTTTYLANTSHWTMTPHISDTTQLDNTYAFGDCAGYSPTGTSICLDSVGDRVNQKFYYRNIVVPQSPQQYVPGCPVGVTCPNGVWSYAFSIQESTDFPNSADIILSPVAQLPPYQVATIGVEFAREDSGPAFTPIALSGLGPNTDAYAQFFVPSCAFDNLADILCTAGMTRVDGILAATTVGSPQMNPSIWGSAEIVGGGGSFSPVFSIKTTNNYQAEGTDPYAYRWGNWSGAAIDPSDGCTFYFVNEYLKSNRTGVNNNPGIWNTWISKVTLPTSGC